MITAEDVVKDDDEWVTITDSYSSSLSVPGEAPAMASGNKCLTSSPTASEAGGGTDCGEDRLGDSASVANGSVDSETKCDGTEATAERTSRGGSDDDDVFDRVFEQALNILPAVEGGRSDDERPTIADSCSSSLSVPGEAPAMASGNKSLPSSPNVSEAGGGTDCGEDRLGDSASVANGSVDSETKCDGTEATAERSSRGGSDDVDVFDRVFEQALNIFPAVEGGRSDDTTANDGRDKEDSEKLQRHAAELNVALEAMESMRKANFELEFTSGGASDGVAARIADHSRCTFCQQESPRALSPSLAASSSVGASSGAGRQGWIGSSQQRDLGGANGGADGPRQRKGIVLDGSRIRKFRARFFPPPESSGYKAFPGDRKGCASNAATASNEGPIAPRLDSPDALVDESNRKSNGERRGDGKGGDGDSNGDAARDGSSSPSLASFSVASEVGAGGASASMAEGAVEGSSSIGGDGGVVESPSVTSETSREREPGGGGGSGIVLDGSRLRKAFSKKKIARPCLTCGHPTCKSHASESFGTRHVPMCRRCAYLFELDFIVDCVTSRDDGGSVDEPRRKAVNDMLECYDRAMILLRYSSQFVDASAASLETRTACSNKIGAGSSSAGVVSGITGIVGCSALLFPPTAIVGAPLLIASLVFGGTATAAQTGDAVAMRHFEPDKLADKMVALHGMALSLLRVVEVLYDALLRDQLSVERYLETENDVDERSPLSKDISAILKRHGLVGGSAVASAGLVQTAASAVTTGVSLVGRSSRYFGRVGTAAMSGARLIPIAGGVLSAACLFVEGKELKRTVDRIRDGNPSEKAALMRVIRDELDAFPESSMLAEECNRIFVLSEERKVRMAALTEHGGGEGSNGGGGLVTTEGITHVEIENAIEELEMDENVSDLRKAEIT